MLKGFVARFLAILCLLLIAGSTGSQAQTNAVPATAPANFVARGLNNQVALSWSSVSDATGYNLWCNAGSGWVYFTTTGNVNNYVDSNLVNGTRYDYAVNAVNAYGASSAFAYASATPKDGAVLIPAAGRVDTAYDNARGILYISNVIKTLDPVTYRNVVTRSEILRYQLSTDSFLAPFPVTGDLGGIDISPDGQTLAVADRAQLSTQNVIHLVDLNSGAINDVKFPLDYYEGGTFAVNFCADGRLLVSSMFNGSGWVPLRLYNPVTATTTVLGTVYQNATLAHSGDRSNLGFAENGISDGPFGRFRIADDNLLRRNGYDLGTGSYNYDIGVNKDGTQYAVTSSGGCFIYSADLLKIGVINTYGAGAPYSAAYHDFDDLVYLGWSTNSTVKAFSTRTLMEVASYNINSVSDPSGNQAFVSGRLKMSHVGDLLFAPVSGGVRYVRIDTSPRAYPQSISVNQNSFASIVLAGRVNNGSTPGYLVQSQPTHGTLSGTAPNLTYTPNTGYVGTDKFTFSTTHGDTVSMPEGVSITVQAPVNHAPVAIADTFNLDEDAPKTSLDVLANDTDIDGDPLVIVSMVSTTDPSGNPGTFELAQDRKHVLFTPAPNFNGTAKFSYAISDDPLALDSNIWVASQVIVRPVNDAPVSSTQSVTLDEDTTKNITLAATDVDGDSLTFSVVSQPVNGVLTGTAPNVVYTPNANFNGSDSFTFKANDGKLDSNLSTVSITVNSVNDAPIANNDQVTMPEDSPPTSIAVLSNDSNVDGGTLTVQSVTQASHGNVVKAGNTVTYQPGANYNGSDSFTYTISDGQGGNATATVNITVTAVNDAPVATDQSVTLDEDTTKTITLTGSDIDGDKLGYSLVTWPTKGKIAGSMPNLVYTPNANFNGTDSFTFLVNDGNLNSAPATVSITVNSVEDVPVASSLSFSMPEDAMLGFQLVGSDGDGDALTYSTVTLPTKGVLSGSGAGRIYTPNANFNGNDSFTFKVNDGKSDSNVATVTINVTPVNDAPISSTQSVTMPQDAPKNITLSATDIDGDALTYSVNSPPTHGSLSGSAPNLVYTPSANFVGNDSFTFVANDGTVNSNSAVVNITVTPVNHAPTSSTQSASTNEDTAKSITLSATDIDGDALTYSVVTPPSRGTLSGSGANHVYTPNANFNGSDSFTFKANDGKADGNTATVNIAVAPVNDAPVAVKDAASVVKNGVLTIAVTANDSDVDGDALTVSSATQGANGSVALAGGGSVKYTPKRNFFGTDTFSYTISDGNGGTATATVAVTVTK